MDLNPNNAYGVEKEDISRMAELAGMEFVDHGEDECDEDFPSEDLIYGPEQEKTSSPRWQTLHSPRLAMIMPSISAKTESASTVRPACLQQLRKCSSWATDWEFRPAAEPV